MRRSAFESWYPIVFSKDIKPNKIYPFSLLGEPLVIYRDKNNKVVCLQDKCAHRSTPLSLGRINKGIIECKYHGWQFNNIGSCIKIPALKKDEKLPPKACVPCKKVIEKHNLVWVYIGEHSSNSIDTKFENQFNCANDKSTRFDFTIDLDIPYELMIENLLDPSHLPFTHHGTLSKRKKAAPISFEIKKSKEIISGVATGFEKKADKKTSFYFVPPHTVYFDVEFSNKGMRQIHYCIPLTSKKMRLNTIFYYKNMPWLKFIPFINAIQKRMSRKIVVQDIAMLTGQDNNINLGAKPWDQAINADKLALNYRRWLEQEIKFKSPWFKGFITDVS